VSEPETSLKLAKGLEGDIDSWREELEWKPPKRDAIWTAETAAALADRAAEHPTEWREYRGIGMTIRALALAGITDLPLQPRYHELAKLFRG